MGFSRKSSALSKAVGSCTCSGGSSPKTVGALCPKGNKPDSNERRV